MCAVDFREENVFKLLGMDSNFSPIHNLGPLLYVLFRPEHEDSQADPLKEKVNPDDEASAIVNTHLIIPVDQGGHRGKYY